VPKLAAVENNTDSANGKRKYLSQSDVPSCSMEKALSIAQAIADNYGFKPSTPIQVASALQMAPGGAPFRMLAGASIAYGFTSGGYNAEKIAIEPLGMRIVKVTEEGGDLDAKRQALLRPRVIREFLQKYDGAPIPKEQIGKNVLLDLDVPSDRTGDVYKSIVDSAEAVSFLRDINGRKYVDLQGTQSAAFAAPSAESDQEEKEPSSIPEGPALVTKIPITLPAATIPASDLARTKRVFITHGKNKALIEPITKLLKFGELEAVVSVQSQTVSQPVPTKVMSEMRACGAAIIHVEDERHLVDKDGNEHVVLNDNVLTEIGAAMALFGERFILVVKDGVKLPSNLQGLLVLPYKGQTLDMEETVKLLEAINDMKQRKLPG
jgi:predicted nucleotide-binding protein